MAYRVISLPRRNCVGLRVEADTEVGSSLSSREAGWAGTDVNCCPSDPPRKAKPHECRGRGASKGPRCWAVSAPRLCVLFPRSSPLETLATAPNASAASVTRRARHAARPRESPRQIGMIRVAAESRLDGRVIASDARKLMGGSMLRPVSARLQTTLTFVL